MRQFRLALAFLTRLPGGRHPNDSSELTAAVPWFPVVGIVVGAIGAAVYVSMAELVAPLPAAAVAFACTALVTGGFHEDGLADTVDALAGGTTIEQRLIILKDSRHGTFGVLALVLMSIIKIGALAELDGRAAAIGLVATHVSGRAAAVGLMAVAPTARQDGLGADYARALPAVGATVGVTVGVAALVGAFWPTGWAVAVAVAALALGVAAVGWWARAKIGGVTGDILGAAEQVGEATVLLSLAAYAG